MADCQYHHSSQYIHPLYPTTPPLSSSELTVCISEDKHIYLNRPQINHQFERTRTKFSDQDHVQDLTPYLDNCKSDFHETLQSFAQFADKIETSDSRHHITDRSQSLPEVQNPICLSTPLSLSKRVSLTSDDCLFDSHSLQTPSAITTGNSTPTLSSSARTTANSSPCCWPLSPASSGRSSASVSDGSASGYSGINELHHNDELVLDRHCDNHSNHRHRHEKRQKNASAAGKYRHRLKGRQRVIHVEMELEEARNRQLRRQLESKMALYCEFVDLLADNTKPQDFHLANSGLESLGSILNELKDQHGSYGGHEQAAYDLHEKYTRFQAILKLKQQQSQS